MSYPSGTTGALACTNQILAVAQLHNVQRVTRVTTVVYAVTHKVCALLAVGAVRLPGAWLHLRGFGLMRNHESVGIFIFFDASPTQVCRPVIT